jgi:hypothetical protein
MFGSLGLRDLLLAFLLLKMTKPAACDRDSCRWLESKGRQYKGKVWTVDDFCPPCAIHYKYGYSYWRKRGIKTKGVCHLLYPPQEVQDDSGDNNNNNIADEEETAGPLHQASPQFLRETVAEADEEPDFMDSSPIKKHLFPSEDYDISDKNKNNNENVMMASTPPPKAKGCQRSCCEQDIFLPTSNGEQLLSIPAECDADKENNMVDYVAATPPAKPIRSQRERNKPDFFISEPNNHSQMASFRNMRYRETNGGEKKKRKALAAIENKARVEALPDIIKEASKTEHGRKILVQAILQDQSKRITVSGVNSKSALSRFKQAAVAVGNGMANLIAPANPKLFLESMASKKSAPATKAVEQTGDDCQETNSTTPRTVSSEDEADGRASFFARTPSPKKKKKRARMSPLEKKKKAREKFINDLGKETIAYLRTLSKPSERRPILATVAQKHSKTAAEEALGFKISDNEWHETRVHAKYPGPGKPVIKAKIFRNRVDKKLLKDLLWFLESPGNLQQFAFGSKMIALFGGRQTLQVDSVARQKKLSRLAADFIAVVHGEMTAMAASDQEVPESQNRCVCMEKFTMRRCMKERGHSGVCSYTPVGSISVNTAMKLIDSMTSGDLKRLSGLDDTKVLKGRDNFERMRTIAKAFLLAGSPELKSMLGRIDAEELYYQTDYVGHLKAGGHHCNCLACGFYDNGKLQFCSIAPVLFDCCQPLYFDFFLQKTLPTLFARFPRRMSMRTCTFQVAKNVLMDSTSSQNSKQLLWRSLILQRRQCVLLKRPLLQVRPTIQSQLRPAILSHQAR